MAATRILPGGAIIDGISMAANITSDILDVQGAGVVGLQFVAASATHVGTFAVELSVDGSTWDATGFQISAGTTATSVAASSGSAVAELVKVDVGQARHLRVTYTFTSGTGTAYVYAVRKRLSAPATGGASTVALGAAASAAAVPVVVATDDAHFGAVGAAADVDGHIHGQLRYIGEAVDALPTALGAAASAAAVPVVLATDDAHLGSVGAAADVDGHIHGQLRYIGEAVDNIPAVGAAAASASLPVAQCTEDAAKQTTIAAGVFLDVSTEGDALAFDSSAKTAQLAAGKYLVCATQDCHIRTMPQASAAATTDSCPLPAFTLMGIIVDSTNDTIAAIKETTAGNLYFVKVA